MRVLWVSLALLLVDQATKQLVHATMTPGQSVPLLGDLLKLTYTTNPGMAFGLTVGPKLFLTLFSIVATALIVAYLWTVRRGPWGYRLSLALIVGGALGNIIDRTFYGLLYGYGPLFHGEVVDFIHVDLWRGVVADWVPFLGGNYLALFPIWNVADMAIVVGVAAIILFQKRFHEGLERVRLGRPADAAPSAVLEVDGVGSSAAEVPAYDGEARPYPEAPEARAPGA